MKFKPHPNMKKLYYFYAIIGLASSYWSWFIPIIIAIYIFMDIYIATTLLLILILSSILILIFIFYWIPRYYDSIVYWFNDENVYARRGVWWIRESCIPWSKVNNVILTQGLLQRLFGLANIGFHTAAMGAIRPEVLFNHLSIDDANKIRTEALRKIGILTVERRKAVEEEILSEIKAIRSILEKLVKT